MPHNIQPFHLAIAVDNLQQAIDFYTKTLGCTCGRSSEHWADFNFFGHQLVCHLAPAAAMVTTPVDDDEVPVPHFGLVLDMQTWRNLVERLQGRVAFLLAPKVRFAGLPGEQATFFVRDPAGNALEFKAFADMDRLFAV